MYIVGDLVESKAPKSFMSRATLQRTDSSGSLQEQGIYQGLVMTNAEKQRLGILPESIYMTANLEQWGEELEHLSIRVETVSEGTFVDDATYQLPTVTFPRGTPANVTARKLTSTYHTPTHNAYCIAHTHTHTHTHTPHATYHTHTHTHHTPHTHTPRTTHHTHTHAHTHRAVAPTPAGPVFLLDIDLRMRKLRLFAKLDVGRAKNLD